MDVKLRFLLELRSSSRIARKSEMDAPPTVRAPDLWSSYYLLLSTLSVSSGIFLHLFEKEYNQDELSELTRFISFCKKKKKPFQEQRLQPIQWRSRGLFCYFIPLPTRLLSGNCASQLLTAPLLYLKLRVPSLLSFLTSVEWLRSSPIFFS